MSLSDFHCLNQIKQRYGGNIKLRSGVKAIRDRLHHKSGIISLIEDINGYIRHPVRYFQLNRICEHYNIQIKNRFPLRENGGWYSGIFDSDGTIG